MVQLLTGPGGGLTAFQGDRCPGSMERGGLFFPESGFPCNPSQVPDRPMRRILAAAACLAPSRRSSRSFRGAAADGPSAEGSYKIEFDNAFGLVDGSQFKVAGVPARARSPSIDLDHEHAARGRHRRRHPGRIRRSFTPTRSASRGRSR